MRLKSLEASCFSLTVPCWLLILCQAKLTCLLTKQNHVQILSVWCLELAKAAFWAQAVVWSYGLLLRQNYSDSNFTILISSNLCWKTRTQICPHQKHLQGRARWRHYQCLAASFLQTSKKAVSQIHDAAMSIFIHRAVSLVSYNLPLMALLATRLLSLEDGMREMLHHIPTKEYDWQGVELNLQKWQLWECMHKTTAAKWELQLIVTVSSKCNLPEKGFSPHLWWLLQHWILAHDSEDKNVSEPRRIDWYCWHLNAPNSEGMDQPTLLFLPYKTLKNM